MDRVHVVDESLHGLMNAADGFIDSVLYESFVSGQAIQRTGYIIVYFFIIKV